MEKEVQEKLQAMLELIVAIQKKHKVDPEWEAPTGKNKDARGTIDCPICKGTVYYSISGYNGHIWGKCETKDCVQWMQ